MPIKPLVKLRVLFCFEDEQIVRYSRSPFDAYNNNSKPKHIPNNGK